MNFPHIKNKDPKYPLGYIFSDLSHSFGVKLDLLLDGEITEVQFKEFVESLFPEDNDIDFKVSYFRNCYAPYSEWEIPALDGRGIHQLHDGLMYWSKESKQPVCYCSKGDLFFTRNGRSVLGHPSNFLIIPGPKY